MINTADACNNVQNANNDDEDNVANSNEQASNKNDAADVDADAELLIMLLQMMLIMTTVVMIDWRRSSLMMVWNLAMRWMTASMIFMELFYGLKPLGPSEG